ncbi:LexA family protein [Pseudomonas aeruginosa]
MNCRILGAVGSDDVFVPFLDDSIPAGFPSPAQDHMDAEISLDAILQVAAPHTYLAEVSNEGFEVGGLQPGTLLLVDRSLDAEGGDLVVVGDESECVLKRLAPDLEKPLRLTDEPECAAGAQVDDLSGKRIWGVVRWSIRRHADR